MLASCQIFVLAAVSSCPSARKRRARGRARAQQRLPVKVRQQLVDAIWDGQPFRTVLRDLGLTSNQVWGLTKTDQEWSEQLDNGGPSERS